MKQLQVLVVSVVVMLIAIEATSGQYFSAPDGATVGRIGKRTNLMNLLKDKPNRNNNKLANDSQLLRKIMSNNSQRMSADDATEQMDSEEAELTRRIDDELFKEILIRYLIANYY